ncbi:unnamed protein product [Cuscuta europaea]|uniref:Uncharacterized protein n=1 Tax=Cuscuta europaea TaxID=41803 RepID=A0A9P0Z7G9_CUSEU|nr:unnamed protein product [Cuscuta europaea]
MEKTNGSNNGSSSTTKIQSTGQAGTSVNIERPGIPNSMPDESIFLQHRKKPELPLIQAFSDASDDFYHSDDSLFTDDFLGHATKSDRRPPISYPEEIRKSKFNTAICWKTNFITSENYMPTENLNTQLKIYRKSQKNKRRHSMQTRSQSRDFPWN